MVIWVMVTIFFSGTGNTKYIAERFSKKMNCDCYSIETDTDFSELILNNKRICVAFPIYDSRVPRIFREFALKYKSLFKDKQIIILVTQMFFSGDGARSFTDLFSKDYFHVIYAEHFNMPNNICNIPLLWRVWVKNGQKNNYKLNKANKKLVHTCKNIKNGKIVKRGFNYFSRLLGLLQGIYAEKIDEHGKLSVKTYNDCSRCGLCVRLCPMKNLEIKNRKIEHKNNCTLCYRCVNACPKKAITTLINRKPKKQYCGV